MKDIASVDYVASEMEMFEDDGLCHSTNSLKTVDDESNVSFVQRASSNANLPNIVGKDITITHARSENMLPILVRKKNRLISTDSGFGSYGPCDLYNSGSVDNFTNSSSVPKSNPAVINQMQKNSIEQTNIEENLETDDKVLPLISETATAPAAEQTTPKLKERYEKIQKQKQQKYQRNTTINSIDNDFELDPKLINRDDGFHDVQCYINENGSPMVREKNQRRRTARKKSTLKEELRARSLGASFDNNLTHKDSNKTPTCVSFSRLFKKLRETFCKWYNFLFVFLFITSIFEAECQYLRTISGIFDCNKFSMDFVSLEFNTIDRLIP